jgi:hypothetical protein
VGVSPVRESNQETGIGYSPHFREKPLRAERLAGPSIAPAKRKNGFPGDFRDFSRSMLMMAPRDTPLPRAARSSHSARSCDSRILNLPLTLQPLQ